LKRNHFQFLEKVKKKYFYNFLTTFYITRAFIKTFYKINMDTKIDTRRMDKKNSKKGEKCQIYNQKHIRFIETLMNKKKMKIKK